MTHSVRTFVNFGCKQLTRSSFSSYNEVNVRQNNVRVLFMRSLSNKITHISYVYGHTLTSNAQKFSSTPDLTRSDPTSGSTQPVDNSGLDQRVIDNAVKHWRRCLRSCLAAKRGHVMTCQSDSNLLLSCQLYDRNDGTLKFIYCTLL